MFWKVYSVCMFSNAGLFIFCGLFSDILIRLKHFFTKCIWKRQMKFLNVPMNLNKSKNCWFNFVVIFFISYIYSKQYNPLSEFLRSVYFLLHTWVEDTREFSFQRQVLTWFPEVRLKKLKTTFLIKNRIFFCSARVGTRSDKLFFLRYVDFFQSSKSKLNIEYQIFNI